MNVHPAAPTPTISRRRLLASSSAAIAGATLLAACGDKKSSTDADAAPGAGASAGTGVRGSSKTPLPVPAQLSESPALSEQVKAGTLPALADRIPASPYVIPHGWVKPGNYGGSMKMNISATSGDTASIAELFYGFSPLRFLNDSTTVGPGLAESWESNADATEWTLHFRKGLKWSDGHPWTTADIMFWWNDMVLYADYQSEQPGGWGIPQAGDGRPATMTAPDDYTIKITVPTSAPLMAEKIAFGSHGYASPTSSWMVPSHFVKQYHPKYNKAVPKNWTEAGGLWESKCDYKKNPACPTMTGFRLSEYHEGRSLVWARNPYYPVVTKDGQQLPFIDELRMTAVADAEVGKIQIAAGQVDYVHGPFNGLSLADVSTFTKAKDRAGIDVLFWNSGSGTGSLLFTNLDYKDPDYQKLFREPKFRQALSLAFDRPTARKAIYFEKGEMTTGTTTPQGVEFTQWTGGPDLYKQWRDAYVKYDPKAAGALLDELGVIDSDGDGWRELPGGRKLSLRIDLQADAANEHKAKDNQMVRDWQAIGLQAKVNPVAPVSYSTFWADGSYMIRSNWEASEAYGLLLDPNWVVPTESGRWAPMQGQWFSMRGTKEQGEELDVDPYKRKPPRVKPPTGGPVETLQKLLVEANVEADTVKRQKLVFDMVKVHIEQGPFYQGTVANAPVIEVLKRGLKNVPTTDDLALGGLTNPWTHPVPAAYDIEAYFWDKPSDHQV